MSPPLKARLGLTALEDRTVPSSVIDNVFERSPVRTVEGDTVSFLVHRSGDITSAVTVSYTVSGTDGSANGSGSVAFAIDQEDAIVDLATTDDTVSEPTKTVVLTVTSGTGYTVGTPDVASINILDNDAQVVSVAKTVDTTEGGTGTFRFTRVGNLSGSLAVNYAVSGTADSGTDFAALSGSVTIPAGEASVNLTLEALTDAIYDPDETVVVTVDSGTGYTPGTQDEATVSITDDVSTVETLIHQQTFQLAQSGTSQVVNVTLTVTFNAPGAPGLYTWSYVVTNPSGNSSSLSSFEIPIDGMDTDVTNLLSSLGWVGTIGANSVSWTAGTALAPGGTGIFSFTTDPREVGAGTIAAGGGGGFLADLPTAPAPHIPSTRPIAQVGFTGISGFQPKYTLKLYMTVAGGGAIPYGTGRLIGSWAFDGIIGSSSIPFLVHTAREFRCFSSEKFRSPGELSPERG